MKRIVTVAIALAVCSVGFGDLRNQWSFEDGTGVDSIGGADGVLAGSGAISNGVLTLNGGQVNIDAPTLGLQNYSAITIEAWAVNSSINDGYHTLFSVWNQPSWYPSDYLLLQPARQDDISRAAIQLGPTTEPWVDESGVNGPEIFDVMTHYAMTVTDTHLALYIDGALVGKTAHPEGSLSGLGTAGAAIGASGYPDPTWQGDVEQLNIYNRALGAAQVAASYATGPVAIPEPATIGLIGIFGAGVLFVRRRFML